jgi:hypothetical protein
MPAPTRRYLRAVQALTQRSFAEAALLSFGLITAVTSLRNVALGKGTSVRAFVVPAAYLAAWAWARRGRLDLRQSVLAWLAVNAVHMAWSYLAWRGLLLAPSLLGAPATVFTLGLLLPRAWAWACSVVHLGVLPLWWFSQGPGDPREARFFWTLGLLSLSLAALAALAQDAFARLSRAVLSARRERHAARSRLLSLEKGLLHDARLLGAELGRAVRAGQRARARAEIKLLRGMIQRARLPQGGAAPASRRKPDLRGVLFARVLLIFIALCAGAIALRLGGDPGHLTVALLTLAGLLGASLGLRRWPGLRRPLAWALLGACAAVNVLQAFWRPEGGAQSLLYFPLLVATGMLVDSAALGLVLAVAGLVACAYAPGLGVFWASNLAIVIVLCAALSLTLHAILARALGLAERGVGRAEEATERLRRLFGLLAHDLANLLQGLDLCLQHEDAESRADARELSRRIAALLRAKREGRAGAHPGHR